MGAASTNIQPIVINYTKNTFFELILIYIDRKLVVHMGSIMDDMEWVVTSLWDVFSWGFHFWPQIWVDLDSKSQNVHSFSIIR